MRDIDDEFDSTDVVRYVPLPVREVEREELTQPVDATMVLPQFDDSELDAVLSQLDAEEHERRPGAITSRGAGSSAFRAAGVTA